MVDIGDQLCSFVWFARSSRAAYFIQRIPADVKERAVGGKLHIPVGEESVFFVVRLSTAAIKLSLRTAAPGEAKRRETVVAGYVETVWQALQIRLASTFAA